MKSELKIECTIIPYHAGICNKCIMYVQSYSYLGSHVNGYQPVPNTAVILVEHGFPFLLSFHLGNNLFAEPK